MLSYRSGPSSRPLAAVELHLSKAHITRSTDQPTSASPFDDRPNPVRIHQKNALSSENAAARAGAVPVPCLGVRWGHHRTRISQHPENAAGGPAAGERSGTKGQGCHGQAW